MTGHRDRLLIAVLCIVACALLHACSERHELAYDSLADASKAGEVTRGWIPDFLPASTRGIRVVHAAASARTWCEFEFAPEDSQQLREHLRRVDHLPEPLKHVQNPGLSWWPDNLTGDPNLATLRKHGFDAYIATEPDVGGRVRAVLFAIDWSKGRGFFYRSTGQ